MRCCACCGGQETGTCVPDFACHVGRCVCVGTQACPPHCAIAQSAAQALAARGQPRSSGTPTRRGQLPPTLLLPALVAACGAALLLLCHPPSAAGAGALCCCWRRRRPRSAGGALPPSGPAIQRRRVQLRALQQRCARGRGGGGEYLLAQACVHAGAARWGNAPLLSGNPFPDAGWCSMNVCLGPGVSTAHLGYWPSSCCPAGPCCRCRQGWCSSRGRCGAGQQCSRHVQPAWACSSLHATDQPARWSRRQLVGSW